MTRALAWLLFSGTLLLAGGCAHQLSPGQRLQGATNLAAAHGWRPLEIEAPPFVLAAWLPEPAVEAGSEALTIYLEGDGLAWRSRSVPSSDPTPVEPVALRLALLHPAGPVAYLARPCQFIPRERNPACEQKYWTSHRFAPEVVAATGRAIDLLKAKAGAKQVRLVGYSGGGAIAVLVAARRNDVQALITVAGNLDTDTWVARHALSPLGGSLNPADAATIGSVPQLHFVGADDRVMPREIAESFVSRQPAGNCAEIVMVKDVAHVRGWAEGWPGLVQTPIFCLGGASGNRPGGQDGK